MSRRPVTQLAPSLRFGACLAALAAGVLPAAGARAQSLAQRIERAPEGSVQFQYAAREGVCGNGRGFISAGGSIYVNDGNWNSETIREQCRNGPVVVVLDRAAGAVIDVDTYVGGAPPDRRAGTDLGTVSARDASAYLLGLAARAEGRPGRAAILPAMLADSADPTPGLLAIARDRDRPRETRRSALSWLARAAESPTAATRAAESLAAVARDAEDQMPVRQQALSALGRLEHGAGIPPLIQLARPQADDGWLAREALDALARSGDPRARELLRSMVAKADVPEALLTVAVRGLAREYATPRDAQLLREVYPRLQSERARQSVLQSIAELGGSANARWLLEMALRTDERQQLRKQALNGAARAGVSATELVRLWDRADVSLKELLLGQYAESGERVAIDRLMAIAKSDEDRQLRRRAVQYLSRSDDPRVKALLAELAGDR